MFSRFDKCDKKTDGSPYTALCNSVARQKSAQLYSVTIAANTNSEM